MTAKRVTIKDVAARAGVSYQTVSRVINDKGEVSPETRRRIQAAIEALGYRPDAIARSMVKGHTHTLGCITPNLTDYTFACIIEGAKAQARERGYFLIATSAGPEEVHSLCDEMLYSRRIDGFIVVNPHADKRHYYFEQLARRGVPVVYSGARPRRQAISCVHVDNENGSYRATRHLIELGRTRIAMITGPQNEDCTQDRIAGYRRAHHEAGLRVFSQLIAAGDWTPVSGYAAMQAWLEANKSIDALFGQNDLMAMGAIQAARDVGRRVPDDLAVVGFDDIPLSAYYAPPLTTVRQDIFEHGRQAARLLIERVENPESSSEHIVLPCELVIRQSCGHTCRK